MQIDQEAFDLLRQQVQADLEKAAELKRQNDLAEQTLKQAQADAQIRHVAERNRMRLALDTNEKIGALVHQLPEIILFIHGIREWTKEDARWKDRVDEILLLLLIGKGNSHSTRELPGAGGPLGGNRTRVEELKRELERSHIQHLMVQEMENLHELEAQAAEYGIDKPVRLINQINKAKETIKELEDKLE